jgi:hypothetical protein
VLEARLGQGGMGTVYGTAQARPRRRALRRRAYDRVRQARVARKPLEMVTPAGRYCFNEFRALGSVGHPNWPALSERMAPGTHWFLTMELIDGVDVPTHLGPAAAEAAFASDAQAALLDGDDSVVVPTSRRLSRRPPGETPTVRSGPPAAILLHTAYLGASPLEPMTPSIT